MVGRCDEYDDPLQAIKPYKVIKIVFVSLLALQEQREFLIHSSVILCRCDFLQSILDYRCKMNQNYSIILNLEYLYISARHF